MFSGHRSIKISAINGFPEFPLVSVALCTYNGVDYLYEQIHSILYQTYKNVELIIIDDCSNDGTMSLLEQISVDYSGNIRIRLFQNKENLGYVKNFEKAVKLCSGDFIALADQDDIWESSKIEQLLSHIGDHLLIYHDSLFVDEKGKSLTINMSDVHGMYEGENPIPFLLFNCVSGHSCMFSRKVFDKIFPFPAGFFHDRWVAYVCSSFGSIKYLNQCLVKYRRHEESIVYQETRPKPPVSKKRRRLEKLIHNRKKVKEEFLWLKKCSVFNNNPLLLRWLLFLFRRRLTAWITPLTFFTILIFNKPLFRARKPYNVYGTMSNWKYIYKNYLFGIAGQKIWYRMRY